MPRACDDCGGSGFQPTTQDESGRTYEDLIYCGTCQGKGEVRVWPDDFRFNLGTGARVSKFGRGRG